MIPGFSEKLYSLIADGEYKAAAQKLNVSRSTLFRLINNEGDPRANVIRKICATYHVSADWLLGLKDDT